MGSDLGQKLPEVHGPVPGDAGRRWVDLLASTESPALTARRARRAERSGAPHDPIVWTQAEGANVVDADGNVFVDLTAGFGAAAVGHAHPRVVAAVREQAPRLMHALGDVHPSDVKVRLLERLASWAPWPEARVILGTSGSDAVEAALKTAVLHTGRPGVLAFEGGYHGLAHGPLAACGYRRSFRGPFAEQLNPHVTFAPFPATDKDPGMALAEVARAWDVAHGPVGAVLVEPVQGRGGVRVPPPGFLQGLEALAHERGALVIADEVMTGLGRCGARWRSQTQGMAADLLCTGKALGGGMPVSGCLGRPEVMASWGAPEGEAIHTGTFFGHPLSCAAALTVLEILVEEKLEARAREGEALWRERLGTVAARHPQVREVRGAGFLAGVALQTSSMALATTHALLQRGWLVLPCGEAGDVLQLSPPLNVTPRLLERFTDALDAVLTEQARP